ncbi:hypothetical protein AJ79_07880 [Helicocarpus griseus UAMH5409]|uniref:Uncharacterized protein n=1 Tax=Helicocarpus griseus UAMH5409 TaxID=1447875 RepID=A0A2B7WY95_9EURO|nr:hypothetical protein AJ79_07880 [Helicocarpus griseus UAMH5409]
MLLGDLPPDLLISIAEHLPSKRDINALSRTARDLHAILTRHLYRHNIRHGKHSGLWWAVRKGRRSTIQRFLSAGATLSTIRSSNGGSLLHAIPQRYRNNARDAHLADYAAVAHLLAANGVDVNAKDSTGCTALIFGALTGDEVSCWPLLECGADAHARDPTGYDATVLHVAARGRAPVPLIRHVVDECGLDIHARDTKGQTPVHYAARGGAADVIRFLAERGVDVNALDVEGSAPIHRLVEGVGRNSLPVFRALVEHGADVNLRDAAGETVLHIGARRRAVHKVIEYLIDQGGADVHATTPRTLYTPAHLAALADYTVLAEYFVSRGADINARDVKGKTILRYVVDRERLDWVEELVEMGADLFDVDEEGVSVYSLLKENGELEYLPERFRALEESNREATEDEA